MPDFDSWTRDPDGRPVDWTRPPYRIGPELRQVCAWEERISDAENLKRIVEYTALARGRVRITDDGWLEQVRPDPDRRRYEPDLWHWFIAEDLDD